MARKRSTTSPSAPPRSAGPGAGGDYRLLFQSNPHPMWVFDRTSLRFLAVNDAAVARYGYTASEFLSMSILDIRPPEDREVVRSVVDALPEQGLGSPGCWRHQTKDGRILEVELSTQSVRFEGAPAVLALAIDVTAQVVAQREAKVHERALQALNEAMIQERAWLFRSQEVARIGAWETDLTTSEVIWSTGTFRLFGLDPASFRPTHAAFLEFVHPEDRSMVDAAFRASYATDEVRTIRHRILPRGGGERFVEERWYTERNEAGTPIRAYGTCQDITEQRAAEVALQASEMRFRTVFETAATGIAITSAAGEFVEVNPAFCAMLGRTAEEIRGGNFASLTHPDDVTWNLEAHRSVVSGGRPGIVMEKRYLHKDGSTVWCRLSVATHRDAEGRPVGAIAVVEDITRQRVALDALRRSEELLQMASTLSSLGAWTVELPGETLNISPAARALQGLDPDEEVTVQQAIDLYVPEHREIVADAYRACAEEGRPFDLQLRQETRQGRRTWVRAIGRAVKDESGRIVRVEGAIQDLTARVETENRERSLASDLQEILGNISDAFFTMDGEWRIRFLNRRAEQFMRRPRNELIGRGLWELFPEAVGTEFDQAYRRALRTGETVEFEAFYPPFDSWLSVRAYPSPDRLAVYFRDVTEQRRAREAMLVSEERFRLLARATNDAIWDWDLRTNAVWWNDGYETLFGYDLSTIVPNVSSWTERVHPEDLERVVGGIHEAIDAGAEQWSAEYRFRRQDGGYAYVLDRGHIIRQGAEAVRMIGGMTDMTDRRVVEERLTEQAALLDSAHEAIAVKDLDDRIVYWNKGAERTYGWPADEVIGRLASEVFGVDQERHHEAWRLLLKHGTWDGELRRRGKDGVVRTVEVRWTLVRRPDGTPRAVFAIHTDITERRRMESQLLRAQRLDSLGTLAGGIAHDLNNVLTPILASIGLLREPLSEAERIEELDAMEESVRRGASLVRQVLTFARGADGRRERVNPRAITDQVTKIVRETFPKSITLQLEVTPTLYTVIADPTQLHQVLLNLCVNSRDAMPRGGTLTLRLENFHVAANAAPFHPDAHPGDYVRMTVIDEGTGIPPEIQDHIFEPFFTTKEHGHGTGLGLSTVHSIVRGHGGFLTLSSTPGSGTRFDVYLPAEPRGATPDLVSVESELLPHGQGELILIVDDEDGIRRVIRRTLERFGYRVIEAPHGAEGVSQYARHRREVAAVLTDLSMPVMDGPTMISAILGLDPKARIIASSGLAEDRDMAGPAAIGTCAVVPKPYTAEILLTTLHEVLHPRR